ncbi:iron complex outermembrane receptor protein [Sphingomonas naasensis]|uniref:TonB-dependent receptor n=1 Tax=Sphingomonas naasensis TaxID=1344951 RepID=A0A4S1WSC2_9SPHN|nr:TonB-dependent receptor [Sphingomonas naasensis]NIJ19114.1 iron complex outermembrane receptor protein [Sphingomonas naasensis]TGX46308.1 TonB-dependent receptor [Sphingomonas naasensis]
MRIRAFLIGTASAMALFSGAAYAQTADETPAAAEAQDGEEVVVTGYRASLAAAIEVKRNANSIVDSISAEDVGKFPNTNVAEALTLVPGVTVDRQFGQGEKVSILGTDPALNRTLLNGQTVASADWFILDSPGRTFNYALLAPQLVSRVDVHKSPEARIDEGSIGGTVNVITRRPLDLKPFTVAGSLGYLYNDRSEKGDVQGSALVSWHNEAGTIGLLASFQRAKDRLRRDGLEAYGTITADFWSGRNDAGTDSRLPTFNQDGSVATPADCTGACATTLTANPKAVFPNAFGTSYFEQGRERLTYSAAAQWRPVPELTVGVDYLRIDATYDNLNQSMYAFPGNVWNSAGQLNALQVQDGIVTQASFTNALSVLDAQYRTAEMHSETWHGQVGWEGVNWNLNVEGGMSDADGGTKKQVFLEFLNWANYTVDISGAPGSPGTISYTTDVLGNPAAFRTDPGWSGNLVEKPTSDKERYGQADLTFKFDGSLKSLQVGYKYRRHETGQRYAGVTVAGVNVPAGQFNTSQVSDNYLRGFNGVNDQMTGRFKIDGNSMVDYVEGGSWVPGGGAVPTPSQFAAVEFAAGNWDVTEDIHAAYAQINFEQGALRGNIGARYVNTSSESAGFVCTSGTCAAATDWVWQATNKTYENVLPSINIAIDLKKDLIFRAAATQVIARPNYADMTNSFWLADSILTGGGGNPDLDPYESDNFNASLEWYFAPRAILAGEIFYKNITNYILSRTVPEQHFNTSRNTISTYNVSRPFNAGSAQVKGFAIAYQQSLPYGFGVLANYTYSDGKGQNDADLPFNSRHQVSLSPFFESGPIAIRGTYTWRSKYFTGIDRGDNMFVRDTANVDLSATYNITENIGLTISGMNLTDSEYYAYANTPRLPRGVYRTGRRALASVNVNF